MWSGGEDMCVANSSTHTLALVSAIALRTKLSGGEDVCIALSFSSLVLWRDAFALTNSRHSTS